MNKENKLLQSLEPIVQGAKNNSQNQLIHYTTEAGLHGILSSQMLWATHFSFLNDKEELWNYIKRHEEDLLFRGIFSTADEAYRKFKENHDLRKLLTDTQDFIDYLLKTAAPFILSFCKILNHDIKNNGDLTMWRSYAHDGGYAVIFTKAELESIMIKEQNAYEYLLGPTRPVEVDYELSEKARESFYKDLLGNLNTKTSPSACFKAVTDGCITKHMAFRAENESRIFCWVNYQVDPGSKKSAKKIHFRTNDNVPYIRLNENSNRLPIKKIIVGPHRLQEERYQKLCIWLNVNGQNPEIVKKSNIPYIGIKV